MIKLNTRIVLIAGVVCLASGAVRADSGDNSMSPFTGESYAAFHGNRLAADLHPQYPLAERDAPAPTVDTAGTTGAEPVDVIIGLPRGYTNPFRDDTAA